MRVKGSEDIKKKQSLQSSKKLTRGFRIARKYYLEENKNKRRTVGDLIQYGKASTKQNKQKKKKVGLSQITI